MVTTLEARQKLETAKSQVTQTRQQLETSEAKLREQKSKLTNVKSKKSLLANKNYSSGISGRLARQKVSNLKSDIEMQQAILGGYKTKLGSYEKDLSAYESQIAQAEAEESAYNTAKEIYLSSNPNAIFLLQEQSDLVKDYYRKLAKSDISILSNLKTQEAKLSQDLKNVSDTNFSISSIETLPTTQEPVIAKSKDIFLNVRDSFLFQKIPKVTSLVSEKLSKGWGAVQRGLTDIDTLGARYWGGEKGFENVKKFQEATAKSQTSDILALGFISPAGIAETSGALKIPLRNIKSVPEFVEVQQPIRLLGQDSTISKFVIKQELSPPLIKIPQTKKLGYLGDSDFLKVVPAKIQTTKTIFPIIGEQSPIFTLTTKTGSRVGEINILRGKSIPTSLEELQKVSKIEQYNWQKLAEYVTGRPVALKNVPKILSKDSQKMKGIIKQFNLGKIKRIGKGNYFADLLSPKMAGRRTKTFQTAGEVSSVKEGEVFDVLTGKVIFKDVTKPFARATGKTPAMEGTIFRFKEPLIFGEETGVQIMRSTGGAKTPLSTTFKDVLIQTPKPAPVINPKIPTSQVLKKTSTLKSNDNTWRITGLLVGGSSRVSSRPSNDFISDFTRGMESSGFAKKTSAKEIGTEKPKEDILQITIPKTDTKTKQKSILLQIPKGKQKQINALDFAQPQVQQSKQKGKYRSALDTLFGLKTKPKQEVTKLKEPFRPEPKKPIVKTKPKTIVKTPNYKIEKEGNNYQVYLKRFGEWIYQGSSSTLKGASDIAKASAITTLGASVKVEKEGKKQDILKYLGFGFRKSKKEKGVGVQKRSLRLGTGSERKEIQFFKKQKTKKNKKVNWF